MNQQNPYEAPASDFIAAPATVEAEKIGGWLILSLLSLIITPIRMSFELYKNFVPMFSNGQWEALTTPGSEYYHSLWAPLLLTEIFTNVFILAFTIYTLVFFLKKSKRVPKLMITWMSLNLVTLVLDMVFANQIPSIAAQGSDPEANRELIRAVISSSIWIPYFLVSKRVKATFVLDWPKRQRAAGAVPSSV